MKILNEQVYHKKYGYGIITDFESDRVTVRFEEIEKKFSYPEVFFKHLSIKNKKLLDAIQKDTDNRKQILLDARKLAEKEAEAAAELLAAKKPVKKTRASTAKKKDENTPSNIAFKCIPTGDDESADQSKHAVILDWKALAGIVQSGVKKGKNAILSDVQKNKLCILTTCTAGSPEKKRFIFGAFIIDEFHQGDDVEEGYVASLSAYRIKLSPKETEALSFWNYHTNKNKSLVVRWGSGLHRYFDDTVAAQILRDIAKIKEGTPDEKFASDFFLHYCEISKINPAELPASAGALQTDQA